MFLLHLLKKSRTTGKKCSYNNFNYDSFINSIINSNLNTLYTITDTLNAWDCYKNECLYICELHAPIRNFRVKNAKNHWINSTIQKLIYKRNQLYKLACKTRYVPIPGKIQNNTE